MLNHSRSILIFAILSFTFCSIFSGESLITQVKHKDKFVISNVSIFNGKDSTIYLKKDVFISAGKIERISEHNSFSYEGYDTIQGKDKYIMPGLIDAHSHIQSNGSVPWAKVKHKQQKVNLFVQICTTLMYRSLFLAVIRFPLQKKLCLSQ